MEIGLKQKLDYSDYAGIPPDGKRYEILDGDLFVASVPNPLHQRVSKRLRRQLEDYFEGRAMGEVFNAPIDVILTHQDVIQPDLVVVTRPPKFLSEGLKAPLCWSWKLFLPRYESMTASPRLAAMPSSVSGTTGSWTRRFPGWSVTALSRAATCCGPRAKAPPPSPIRIFLT